MSMKQSKTEGVQPLNINLINQILKLQQLFHSKYLTPQLLNEMVALYVAAVQCFDQAYSPMRSYFLGKIQLVLSRPEVMKMLGGQGEKQDKLRETIRLSGVSNHIIDEQIKGKDMKIINYNNVNEDDRNKERNLKIEMQMKIMRQVQQTVKLMSKQVQNIDKKQKEHDQAIGNMIEKQENMLSQRLANRKKKLRKKSVQIKKKDDEDQQQLPIKKEELVMVQKELTMAIVRMTVRLTQKQNKTGILLSNSEPQKGRVNLRRDNDEQEEQQIKVQQQRGFKKKPLGQKIEEKQSSSEGVLGGTTRLGTVHDPKDKGRVTFRKRNDSQD